MAVMADQKVGSVKASGLNYLKQGRHADMGGKIVTSLEAEYDACYYEVKMDQKMLENWIPTKLNLKITSKTVNMKAFMWGGNSRKEATKKLVPGNSEL